MLPHEFKLPVGRNEGDGVFRLELAQLDALVELAVVDDHHGLASARRVVRIARHAAREGVGGDETWKETFLLLSDQIEEIGNAL